MTESDGHVIDYLQKRFEEDYSTVNTSSQHLSREAIVRRWTAYLLKAIAVFGGIAIAAGLNAYWSHVVGVLIAVVVGTDGVFSNHKRLLIVTAAANAYSNLLRNIRQTYNQKLGDVLRLKTRDKAAAESQLGDFIGSLLRELNKEQNQIESGIQSDDLKLLQNISVEQHAAATAAGAGAK
jgi:hypothetical protein